MSRSERECPDCGEILGRASRFCPGCGNPIGSPEDTAEAKTAIALRPPVEADAEPPQAPDAPGSPSLPSVAPADPDDWPAAVQDQLVAPVDGLPAQDGPARHNAIRPPRRPTAEQVASLHAAAQEARQLAERRHTPLGQPRSTAPAPLAGLAPATNETPVAPLPGGRTSAADVIDRGVLELDTNHVPRRPTPEPVPAWANAEPYGAEELPAYLTSPRLLDALPGWVWILVLATALGLVAIVVIETTSEAVSYGGPWRPVEVEETGSEARRIFAKGRDHLEAKRYRAAAKAFRQALAADASFARAHIGLGVALAGRDQRSKAVAQFRMYLTKKPDGEDAELARTLIKVHGGGEVP